jgi:hypothetical protein
MRVLTFRFPFISGQIIDKRVDVGVRIHTMYSVWVIIHGALGEISGVHDNQPMRQRGDGPFVSGVAILILKNNNNNNNNNTNNNFQHSNNLFIKQTVATDALIEKKRGSN